MALPVNTGQGIGKRINCHNNPYTTCDSSEDETDDAANGPKDEDTEEVATSDEEVFKPMGKVHHNILYRENQTTTIPPPKDVQWHFASKPSFLSMMNPNNQFDLSSCSPSSSPSSSSPPSSCSSPLLTCSSGVSISKKLVANCKSTFTSRLSGKGSNDQEIYKMSIMDNNNNTLSNLGENKPLESPFTTNQSENRASLVKKDEEYFKKLSGPSSSSEKRRREEEEKKTGSSSCKSSSCSSLSRHSKEKMQTSWSSSKSGSDKSSVSTIKINSLKKSGDSEQKSGSSSSSRHKKETTTSFSSSSHHQSCSSVERKPEKERTSSGSSGSSKRKRSKENSDVKRKSHESSSSHSKSKEEKSKHRSSKETSSSSSTSSSKKRKHTVDLLQNTENLELKHSNKYYSNEKLRDEKHKEKHRKKTENVHLSSRSTKTYSEHHHIKLNQSSTNYEKREGTRRDANNSSTKRPDSKICIVKPIIVGESCNNPSSSSSSALSIGTSIVENSSSVYNYRSIPGQMLWGPESYKMTFLEYPLTSSNNLTVTGTDFEESIDLNHHFDIDWDFVEDILQGCSTEDLMALVPNL